MDIKEIQELYNKALENYKETKSDYEAGILEGLKRVLELMKKETK